MIPGELILFGLLLLLMLLNVLKTTRGIIASVGVIGLILAATGPIKHLAMGTSRILFNGMIVLDPLAETFKLLFLLAAAFSVVFAYDSKEIDNRDFVETILLMVGSTLGMFFMAGSNDMLMMYLSIEFVALTSYMLAGFRRGDPKSSEAALKYVIYGGAASGVMLFGLSLLFGLAGSTGFVSISHSLVNNPAQPVVLLALVMVFAGLGYKIASVPFHQWCPDVYQGSPTPVTAFFSVAPKAAGFALLLRFLLTLFKGADFGGLNWTLTYLLGIIAMGTMTYGNLTAMGQRSVKRLLAYSSIAHAGYVLMGVTTLYAVMSSTPDMTGFQAVFFYMTAYLFMNLGAFYVVALLMDRLGTDDINAYTGLGQRAPLLASIMTIFLFSLAGIPPTIGFIGKFYLFYAVIKIPNWFFYLLAFVGVTNSFISLFYYARILKHMFLIKSSDTRPLSIGALSITVLLLLAVPTLLFGLYFSPIFNLASRMF